MKACGFKEIPLGPHVTAEGPFHIGVDLAAQDDQTVVHLPLAFHKTKKKAQLLVAPEMVYGDCHDPNAKVETLEIEIEEPTMGDIKNLKPGQLPQINVKVNIDPAQMEKFNAAMKNLQKQISEQVAPALAKMGHTIKHNMSQVVKLHFDK